MKTYITEMNKCIELALNGAGETSPNPMVGCVILDSEEKEIVSTGYHKKYGENHAERDALLKLENAKGCTLIVNLEPCSHFGKTPPCCDLIIEKGIKRVVYGMQDPNPVVSGNGLKKLQAAGVEVIGPILEKECRDLNEVFVKNHVKKQIFVALKTATTIDGKIATYCGDSKWITSEAARAEVRNIRKRYDAILTSSSTVLADNPEMFHKKKIILDRTLKTDLNSKIYEQGDIYLFHDETIVPNHEKDNVKYIPAPIKDGNIDIEYVLNKLYELKIMSVLVESGGVLNAAFLPYVDKLYHFIAPKVLGDNSGKSCFSGQRVDKISNCKNLEYVCMKSYEPDVLLVYKNLS